MELTKLDEQVIVDWFTRTGTHRAGDNVVYIKGGAYDLMLGTEVFARQVGDAQVLHKIPENDLEQRIVCSILRQVHVNGEDAIGVENVIASTKREHSLNLDVFSMHMIRLAEKLCASGHNPTYREDVAMYDKHVKEYTAYKSFIDSL